MPLTLFSCDVTDTVPLSLFSCNVADAGTCVASGCVCIVPLTLFCCDVSDAGTSTIFVAVTTIPLPWTDTPVCLLQDPADPFAPEIYRFPGERSGGFHRSQLIAQSGKTLTRREPLEGFLLGFHDDPIPRSFRHGTKAPIVLTIEDQFGETYSRELFLTVDRLAERGPKPKPSRPLRNLFDKPDSPKSKEQTKSNLAEVTAASCVEELT